MARTRDYKAEYAARIAKGKERGLSRAQAAGHASKTEKSVSQLKREGIIKPSPKVSRPVETGAKPASKTQIFYNRNVSLYAAKYGISPKDVKKDKEFQMLNKQANKDLKRLANFEKTLHNMQQKGKNTAKQVEKIKELRKSLADTFKLLGRKKATDETPLGVTDSLT